MSCIYEIAHPICCCLTWKLLVILPFTKNKDSSIASTLNSSKWDELFRRYRTLCELSLNIWRQFIGIYQEHSNSFQGSFALLSILYLQPALFRPNCKCDLPSKFVLLLKVEDTYFSSL